jgi:hypothetical protein
LHPESHESKRLKAVPTRPARAFGVPKAGRAGDSKRDGARGRRDHAMIRLNYSRSSGATAVRGLRRTPTFEVGSVDAKHRKLAVRGVELEKPPQKLFCGYRAQLRDPDAYLIISMR